VLVVEDDVCVRAVLTELLVEEGFEVTQASNGFSALRLATEHRPHVVLLDIVLPELSGIDVLRQLRSSPQTRDIGVIVVTGNPDRLTAADRLNEVDAVMPKPFEIDELLSTLRTVLTHSMARAVEVPPVSAAPLSPDRHLRHVLTRRAHPTVRY
jgi:DNA-binding response OmpR family regulator